MDTANVFDLGLMHSVKKIAERNVRGATLRPIATIAFIGAVLALPSSASAQSIRAFAEEGRTETRVMAGITIPFGGTRSTDKAARMDMKLQSARIGQSTATPTEVDRTFDDYVNRRESRISLTFENEPRFLINGRSFASYRLQAAQEQEQEQPVEETSLDPDEEGISEEERKKRRERRRREAAVDVVRPVAKGALIAGGVVALGLEAIALSYATADDGD